jgi:hypothetical protein
MRNIALGGVLALALVAPALAAPDAGAVSTASDTDELISQWLKAPPPAALEPGAAPAEAPLLRDRRVHGEIGVGIGTGGYREAYGVADIPLGDKADATVAVRDVQGRVWGRNVHDRSFGLDLAFGDAARALRGPAERGPPACADLRAGRYLEPLWVTRMRAAGGGALAACPEASPEG